MNRVLYLHGFASGPGSAKARILARRFAGCAAPLEIPDLARDGFFHLTITRQLRIVEEAAGRGPVDLIGSSLGGYLAALYAARHAGVEKLVLLAPAFGFARRWAESLGAEKLRAWREEGSLAVMHYGEGKEMRLGWQFLADAQSYEEEPAITQPCLIFHGIRDVVVPVTASRAYARTRTCCELRELDSDHELLDQVDTIWEGIRGFLALYAPGGAAAQRSGTPADAPAALDSHPKPAQDR